MASDDVLRNGRPDLSPGIYRGLLKEVVDGDGTGLVGAHAAGATVLNVAAGAFRTSGSCRVDGTVYAYVRDGDTLAITPPLVAAADDGDPVESLTPAGESEVSLVAVVDLDMDGDPENDVHATISGDLAGYYPRGDAGAGALVTLRDTPYGYAVAGRPTDAPPVNGLATNTGHDDISIEPGNSTTPSAIKFISDGAYYDLDSPASLSCFDSPGPGTFTSFYVRLQGAKVQGFAALPRIDIFTYGDPTAVVSNVDLHAGGGGAGGTGYHRFFINGDMKMRVDSSGVYTMANQGFYDETYTGGGSTGASVNNNGRLVRTTSSLRFKDNVETLTDDVIDAALGIRLVTFTRKDEADQPEPRVYVGAIAEEVAEAGCDSLVFHNADGDVEGVHYDGLAAVALAAVQRESARKDQQIADLTAQLAELCDRVATLEGV